MDTSPLQQLADAAGTPTGSAAATSTISSTGLNSYPDASPDISSLSLPSRGRHKRRTPPALMAQPTVMQPPSIASILSTQIPSTPIPSIELQMMNAETSPKKANGRAKRQRAVPATPLASALPLASMPMAASVPMVPAMLSNPLMYGHGQMDYSMFNPSWQQLQQPQWLSALLPAVTALQQRQQQVLEVVAWLRFKMIQMENGMAALQSQAGLQSAAVTASSTVQQQVAAFLLQNQPMYSMPSDGMTTSINVNAVSTAVSAATPMHLASLASLIPDAPVSNTSVAVDPQTSHAPGS